MKISKVVFCLVLANALFAGGEKNLYTLKNGTLLKVTEVSQGQYKDSNGDSVNENDILMISKINDTKISMGKGATSSGDFSMALGMDSIASGYLSNAIGYGTQAQGAQSLALGTQAQAEKLRSFAIGSGAKSLNNDAFAIGNGAIAKGDSSIAIGEIAEAEKDRGIALGIYAKSRGMQSLAIGPGAQSLGKEDSIAIGTKSKATQTNSTAIGILSVADGFQSNAIGAEANATGERSIAFGSFALAKDVQGIAIGNHAKSIGHSSNAIGVEANATGVNSNAFGTLAEASGDNSNAIGFEANATGDYSLALGFQAKALKDDSIAIGPNALAENKNATAIGPDSKATGENSLAFGKSARSENTSSIAIGDKSYAKHSASIAIGPHASTIADNSVSIGFRARTSSNNSVSIGTNAEGLGDSSTAIGEFASATQLNSIAIGHKAIANGPVTSAIGSGAMAYGKFSMAIGKDASVGIISKKNYGNKINEDNSTMVNNALAIGNDSKAKVDKSVALGGESVASTGSGAKGLDFATGKESKDESHVWKSTAGAVSVGDKTKNITRQITNVAAGTEDTDAVNVAQLKSLKKYSDNTFAKKTDIENIQNNLNGKISDIEKGDNIEVDPGSTNNSKKISLAKNLKGLESAKFKKDGEDDKTNIDNKTIEIGDNDIKAKISKNEIVLSNKNSDKSITIKNDKEGQHILGLSNKEWNGNIVSGRAATEDQLKSATENLQKNIAANNTKVEAGENIAVKKETGSNGTTFTVSTAKNVKFNKVSVGGVVIDKSDNSIKAGDTKLDNNGLTVGNDVKLTKKGLDNGGNKITNVAEGTENNHAATVGQLNKVAASASAVKESDKKDKWAEKRPEAKGKNSLSIGGGSNDNGRSNTVSVGTPGHERTISNVANPVKGTDAVNLNYLNNRLADVYGEMKNIKDEGRAGSASAIAIGGILQATIPGKNVVSISGGNYENQNAVAFGVSGISSNGQWLYKAGGSYDTQNNHGFQVSVGFQF
ncbi:YadA-like family protein [Campylobacter ureolyticus]|uniref:YadA-like family protein n=1 Tax=Campylobacter ureolyticus TaxID=827 RepID=UPI00215A44FB|nr:YadA-like family protein [Campylobacter ureolyticus]MCR8699277.1 YadA-like family protein [Campylobacter ureolyticus]